MASVLRLAISGIRSFSDETQETIQFGKPLTLIVGTNGSGKTTIIECLRYATTNELPPGTKTGASFINDPNLHSANETKAQIKLAFADTKGGKFLLSKSLMAIKNSKTKNISFKTKENQLTVLRGGEKQSVSSKMADIESLMPKFLGVSKAILNYVVFCHQDESLWPISESAVLKKKFDEIFDSSKFIKILDSIKSITKEINVDVKLINNNVEHLKNDKIRSNHKKKAINTLNSQISENKTKMEEAQRNIDDVTRQLQLLYTSNQDYERIISKMESLQQDKRNLKQNIETIKSTTSIIHKHKDVLLDELNNFADVLAQQTRQCTELEESLRVLNSQLTDLRNQSNELMVRKGSLESLYKKNEENMVRREALMTQFASILGVSDITEFDHKLNKKLENLQKIYKERELEYSSLLASISKDLEKAKFAQMKEQQHSEYMNKDKNMLSAKLEELNSKHSSIAGNQTRMKTFKDELTIKQDAFAKLKALNEVATLNGKVEESAKELTLLEAELEDVQNKLQTSRRNNDLVSKVQVLEDMNVTAQRQLDAAYSNLKGVLGDDISPENAISAYEDRVVKVEKFLNKSRSDLASLNFRKSKLETDHAVNAKTLNDHQALVAKFQFNFKKANDEFSELGFGQLEIDATSFHEALEVLETAYTDELNEMKDREIIMQFNERAITFAEAKHKCVLCRRKFPNEDSDCGADESLSSFLNKLKLKNDQLGSAVNLQGAVERKERLQTMMRSLDKDISEIAILINEKIPKLTKQNCDDKDKIKSFENDIKSIEEEVIKKRQELEQLRGCEQDISIFKHQHGSVSDRATQIDRLREQLSEQGLSMSTEELERMNKDIYGKTKNIRSDIDSIKLDRDMKMKRNNEMENEINQLKLKINDLELKSLDKVNIEKAINETKVQIDNLTQNLGSATAKIDELAKEVAKFENDHAAQMKAKEEDLGKLNAETEKYASIKRQFAKSDEEIREYVEQNVEAKYADIKLDILNNKSALEDLSKRIEELNKELKDKESLVSDSAHQERNIRSNLNLIQFEEDLEQIEEEIRNLDTKQAHAQRDEYLRKTSQLQEVQNSHQKAYATILGETTQLERQIREIHNEINRDYKDIDKKYTAEYAKLQTKLAMATDLTTLYKATDNGVMEFHQTQMAKINNILDELWKKTYTGNDVETIKIKADPIAARKSGTTATNNRSYNYRVVMVKNGTELDMRGRCSAGQRVLASIIIRIALAECFCLNFGMIALDEPTTNLDDENVESLARALHSIIKDRSAQKNFQLIIITHDEKFLRCMNAVDFTDHYYKVLRNERLNSTINKVSISTVTEG